MDTLVIGLTKATKILTTAARFI